MIFHYHLLWRPSPKSSHKIGNYKKPSNLLPPRFKSSKWRHLHDVKYATSSSFHQNYITISVKLVTSPKRRYLVKNVKNSFYRDTTHIRGGFQTHNFTFWFQIPAQLWKDRRFQENDVFLRIWQLIMFETASLKTPNLNFDSVDFKNRVLSRNGPKKKFQSRIRSDVNVMKDF